MDVGIYLHVGDEHLWLEDESHIACNTVPVALRLVGHAVRVLSHTHVLNAIVDVDVDVVVGARLHILGDFKQVGH